jgi:hypothetical protein
MIAGELFAFQKFSQLVINLTDRLLRCVQAFDGCKYSFNDYLTVAPSKILTQIHPDSRLPFHTLTLHALTHSRSAHYQQP